MLVNNIDVGYFLGNSFIVYKYRLTPTEIEQILILVADGNKIVDICKQFHISTSHFNGFLLADSHFRLKFDQAREIHADILVDSLLTIADNCITPADASAARIKSDNIKYIASKRYREQYGEKIEMNVHQTLDLSDVLRAANARVVPMLDQQQNQITQPIETIDESKDNTTGLKPVGESFDDLL